MAVALDDAVLADDMTLFDYGCGRGGDLRRLTALGIACDGWDPVHRPGTTPGDADVVNLGYVVNVIEEPHERERVLADAWRLARRALVVSARLVWDARDLRGRPYRDGVLTGTGTFQRFYTQDELRTWIEQVLCVTAYAAAPGIFYVFRDPTAGQAFLAARVRHSGSTKPWVSELLFDQHHDLLEPFVRFLGERGRLPRTHEIEHVDDVRRELGSLGRAYAVIRHVTGASRWEELRQDHARDLLVYLALSRFGRRPKLRELPDALRLDIREFFRSYQNGCQQADRLLFAAGNLDAIDLATCTSRVGKLTPTALYVHRTALHWLPAVLRVYEGCARTLVGTVAEANIIKLHREQPIVSYLAYPDFDRDPHPALATAITVNLRKLTADLRDYRQSDNPPVLHRKEDFLAPNDPQKARYQRLTRQEERHGLYERPEVIGTKLGWHAVLDEQRLAFRGHRLVRSDT